MSDRSVIHSAVPASLSNEQFATLATVLTFLEGFTIQLDADNPIDVELTCAFRDLGQLCISKLLQDFPALQLWRALGDGDVQ